MKLKITIKERNHINLLTRISLILFGVFITTLVFALFLKLLESTGIYLAVILCIIVIILGFKYSQARSKLRLITWSVLGTVIFCISSYIIILYFLLQNFKDL